MNGLDLTALEKQVLECLDEERDLAEWWSGVKKTIAAIQVDQFCATVKSLTDKELVMLGEGVPDPYFGRPEHFEIDERVDIEMVESLLTTFASDSALDDFGL